MPQPQKQYLDNRDIHVPFSHIESVTWRKAVGASRKVFNSQIFLHELLASIVNGNGHH